MEGKNTQKSPNNGGSSIYNKHHLYNNRPTHRDKWRETGWRGDREKT